MTYLAYVADPVYGGWVSYTSHLASCFMEMNIEVQIVKVAARTEKSLRHFNDGLCSWNISLQQAEKFSRDGDLLITAIGQTRVADASALLSAGARAVIHDPTELTAQVQEALRLTNKPLITVRKMNVTNLERLGYSAIFVPHPYVAPKHNGQVRGEHSVSISRVDWDKNTHLLLEANSILGQERKVKIYGSVNRLYAFHKLQKAFPEWEGSYLGRFPKEPNAAFGLASGARWVVDMSVIKGDGGGTQYTFLEAWAAGTPLLVHKEWIKPGDEMVPGENCCVASSGVEIAETISSDKTHGEASYCLQKHAPSAVVPQFLAALKA